ncbi:MAG: DNA polymerase IV [bacterium]|nr:DNA polymerase IV [bacterium]
MSMGSNILHADLDSFYASVEQLLDPSLRRKAIAVGASATGGVVLACSYEAKAFGVSGGMPGWRAARLCPDLIFVRGNFHRYKEFGDRVIAVMEDFTPLIQRISIDEAFLDVSGATHLFGPPDVIAARLRARVANEVGLPISVGVARTKSLAKIASQVAKPNGLVVVPPEREREFLDPLPVRLMWGVGPVTEARLAERGIRTIGQLAATPRNSVERLLGHGVGEKLSRLAVNEDPRRVTTSHRGRSVGAQSAMGRRAATHAVVRETLGQLTDRVTVRLRASGLAGRTLTVRVRLADMRSLTRSHTFPGPIATTLTLTETAERLAWDAIGEPGTEISLLGVSISNLERQPFLQLELPLFGDDPTIPGSESGSSRLALDTSMDAARTKFGKAAVGYLPAHLRDRHGTPDPFRELAERDL